LPGGSNNDTIFKALVVRRSRGCVKESQEQLGGTCALFPKREDPKVAVSSVQKTYGRLLEIINAALKSCGLNPNKN
jgi:hypothetical protein